jgi:hypothetical protein
LIGAFFLLLDRVWCGHKFSFPAILKGFFLLVLIFLCWFSVAACNYFSSELRRSSGSGDHFRTSPPPSFSISDRATADEVPHRLISTVDHCLLPSPSPSPATRYCQEPSPTTHTQPPTGSLPVPALFHLRLSSSSGNQFLAFSNHMFLVWYILCH